MASSAATRPDAHGTTCLITDGYGSVIQAPLMPWLSLMMTR